MFERELFTEAGPELTPGEISTASRSARRSAIQAQSSLFRTARSQYRAYRREAGERFMAWPEWHRHYLDTYNSTGSLGGAIDHSGFGGNA